MDLFMIIWLILIPVINGINVFLNGMDRNPFFKSESDEFERYFMPAILSIVWPFLLIAFLVASPFLGLYYWGKSLRK